jgi:hypothetical protein
LRFREKNEEFLLHTFFFPRSAETSSSLSKRQKK